MNHTSITISLLLSALVGIPVQADTLCRHQDGRWEHRVDEDGNLDIAVTAMDDHHHIYIGGSPGRLQMIKVDGGGDDIPLLAVKDQPGLQVAEVTLSSDISAPASTLAFFDPAGGGTLILPVPNLLAVLLRSHTLTLNIPHKGKPAQTFTVDVSDIPVGAGHRCERINSSGEDHDTGGDVSSDSTLPLAPAQVIPPSASKGHAGR